MPVLGLISVDAIPHVPELFDKGKERRCNFGGFNTEAMSCVHVVQVSSKHPLPRNRGLLDSLIEE